MSIVYLVLSIAVLLLSLTLILGNWVIFWRVYVSKKLKASWIPLVGGVLGAVGLILLPVRQASGYWWVPLLVDFGCAPGFLYALWWHVMRKRNS